MTNRSYSVANSVRKYIYTGGGTEFVQYVADKSPNEVYFMQVGSGGQFGLYRQVGSTPTSLLDFTPTNRTNDYGPTSNATAIRKSCTTMGKLCIISGIGTTTAELPASGYLTVWSCPTATHYHECFMTLYDSPTRIRGYVDGNGVTIWNDTGADIPAGRIFVFMATYLTA